MYFFMFVFHMRLLAGTLDKAMYHMIFVFQSLLYFCIYKV